MPGRFSLSRRERIKSRKLIKRLYGEGSQLYSTGRKLSARFLISGEPDAGIKVTVAVSKRAGNAVWRNRVKRLLREAYRLNKHGLLKVCSRHNISLCIIFSPYRLNQKYNKVLALKDLMPALLEILNSISEKLEYRKQ